MEVARRALLIVTTNTVCPKSMENPKRATTPHGFWIQEYDYANHDISRSK